MSPDKLVVSTVFLCAMAQVNATMMQYNTSNQMIKYDNNTMSYSPKGYLASVDDVHIMHGGGGFIEKARSMTATMFGGVRLLSNGVSQSIFTDNHSTLKTASADNIQHSYTDPYGNATPKIKEESYPLERNRMTFDGGYEINPNLINFGARSYLPLYHVFASSDSYDVPNRYNFSSANPVMKFDPSGHNAEGILNFIGNLAIGVDVGTLLTGSDGGKERYQKAVLSGLENFAFSIFAGLAIEAVKGALTGEAITGEAITKTKKAPSEVKTSYHAGYYDSKGETAISPKDDESFSDESFFHSQYYDSENEAPTSRRSSHIDTPLTPIERPLFKDGKMLFSPDMPQKGYNCGLVGCGILMQRSGIPNRADNLYFDTKNPMDVEEILGALNPKDNPGRHALPGSNAYKNSYHAEGPGLYKPPSDGARGIVLRVGPVELTSINHWYYFEINGNDAFIMDRLHCPKGETMQLKAFLNHKEYADYLFWNKEQVENMRNQNPLNFAS